MHFQNWKLFHPKKEQGANKCHHFFDFDLSKIIDLLLGGSVSEFDDGLDDLSIHQLEEVMDGLGLAFSYLLLENLGDTTTLADPTVVEQLIENRMNK